MNNEEIKQATEQVITEMLTESTGRHFMDSGDAYGRHWEENQKNGIKTGYQICDFYVDKEEQTCELIPIIPIFDVFSNTLQYTDECKHLESLMPQLVSYDALYWIQNEVEQGKIYDKLYALIVDNQIDGLFFDEPYIVRIQLLGSTIGYATQLLNNFHQTVFKENKYIGTNIFNSYNRDNFISQDYMSTYFEYESEPYIAISIHNGCDIRGGYTDVHIFDVGYEDDFLTAQTDVSIDCLHTDGKRHICESGYQMYDSSTYYSHLEQKDVDEHYIYQHTYVDENNQLRCKECNGLIVCNALTY